MSNITPVRTRFAHRSAWTLCAPRMLARRERDRAVPSGLQPPCRATRRPDAAGRKDLADRIPFGSDIVRVSDAAERLQAEAPRPRLCGRADSGHRVPVGRGPIRTASCHGDGTGTTEGGPHPHSRWYSTDACRQGRNQDHPYRLLRRDAVESGLVASLARPGGNLTG